MKTTLGKVAALATASSAALLIPAGLAQASARPVPVTSRYSCAKTVTARNPNGTWKYDEQCDLTVTITGPVKDIQVKTTGRRGEAVMFQYGGCNVWVKGVLQREPQGGYTFHPETVPYTLNWRSSVPADERASCVWDVEVPLSAPKPLMQVVYQR
jgi:hypothetical protein